nr:MAG TPA: hypothetical protein [Caudoviricetes sp.]
MLILMYSTRTNNVSKLVIRLVRTIGTNYTYIDSTTNA